MQDLRDLYKAYSAVHDTTIKEELDNSKDQISGMNLSKMRDEDLVEVAEEIIEGLFQYGKTLDEAYEVVGAILEEASDNIIGDRKVKITRIAEAFDKAFDTVTDKAERNCEESFLKYRQTKPLTEKWHNKVSHEVGNAKVHASVIHEDRECVKKGLIELISEKLDKVGQEDADIDNDGDVDSSDKYLAKRRKAIGKAMKKEEYVTELSKKTLGSYVKKASQDAADRNFDHGESEKRQYDPDEYDEKETKKLANRQKGIGRAVDKMMKKEGYVSNALQGAADAYNKSRMPKATPAIKQPSPFDKPPKPQVISGPSGKDVPGMKGGGLVKKVKMKKEETQVAELYKGKHGQSEKEYADSRSQGGKMVSGDSKGSGAEYTHGRRVKAANPGMQPDVGGKTKPKSQGKMDAGSREDLKYRKARMFSKEELEAIQAKVDSWEEGYQRNPEKGEAEAKKSETSGQRAERNVRDRLKTMDPARAEAMKKQMRAVGLDV